MAFRRLPFPSRRLAAQLSGGAVVAGSLQSWLPHRRSRTLPAAEEVASSSCVVLGAGVVGLTTAYFLKKSGRYSEIHVVEQREDCALGCSFQNGGVINVEAIAPVNSYMSLFGTLKGSLMHSLTSCGTNTVVTWRAFLEPPDLLLRWCYYFWQNCDEASIQRNSRRMMQLGKATGPIFEEVAKDLKLDAKSCNFSQSPGLVLFESANPEATVEAKHARFGAVHRKQYVTGNRLQEVMEGSALLDVTNCGYNVGCVEPNNYTVNTLSFCQRLRSYLESQGVRFHFSSTVADVATEGRRVKAVVLADGSQLPADRLVLCAGYETCYLAKRLGISLPLAPVKAYSLHISDAPVAGRLKYATHLEANVACLITPYKDSQPTAVRVTGIRDLDGYNEIMREDRLAALLECARRFLGHDFDAKEAKAWAGVMAVSPDDFPVVGGVQKFDNLFVNVGHGFRGTNWSVATAKFLSQVMAGQSETCLDPESTAPARFGV